MTPAAFFRLASLTFTVALAGCAALQIDVDVYKGPLVNEQEIQLRQFAALAIAAKPMLASVRNELEETASGKKNNWEDEYVDSRDMKFTSELARFVNGAMLYYADLGDEAAIQLERGRQRASEGLATFRSYEPGDVALADELLRATADERADSARSKFADQYRNLLCHAPTAASAASAALRKPCPYPVNRPIEAPFYRWPAIFMHACQEAFQSSSHSCPDSIRSNSLYRTLSDPDVVERHAQFLFGPGNHDNFIRRIGEIARSYIELREGMRDVLQGALGLTGALATDTKPGSTTLRENLPLVLAFSVQPRTLACAVTTPGATRVRAAWQVLPEAARNRLDAAGIASSPASGTQAVPGDSKSGGDKRLPQSGSSAAPVISGSASVKEPASWNRESYARAQVAMEDVVRDFPVAFADFLRVVDQEIIALPDTDVHQCELSKDDRDYVAPKASRRYGLASAPSDPTTYDFIVNFPKMEQSTTQISKAQAMGFDKGRLPMGIERLTQDFLQALDDNHHQVDAGPVREARQRLEEALIFFAERMLFVVNTVNASAIERDIGGKPDTTRSATATRNEGEHQYAGTRADRVARLASRVAVLQSLGNSLVLQANDLRRQLNHSVQQEARLQGEIDATRRALNPGAPVVFDALMVQADAQLKQQANAVARAASGAAAAELRFTQTGRDLDDALKAEKAAADKLAERTAAFKPLESLVRTYISWPDRHGLYPPDPKVDAQEGADQKRLQDALSNAFPSSENVETDTYLDAIRAWLRLTASGLGDSGARFERLDRARAYLEDPKLPLAGKALPAASRSKLGTTIRDLLLDWAGDQSRQLAVLKASAATQATAASSARIAQAKSQRRMKGTETVASASQTPPQNFANVMKVLTERRDDVLRGADRMNVGDPASVILLLRNSVAALPTQTDETRLTLTFLAGFQPPLVATYTLPPGWMGKTPTDVYDQLIAQLRQARIQAELAGLTDQSARVQKAINLAYEARSGVAFLRPASDYLKSVYSSTNLQDAVDPAQENLLDAWWKRMLPSAQGGNSYEREARHQTEKLYWQNINRVSLSGGGRTNYVIAKDDIGNWYVKAYSSDPGPIIRSAQSLALFSSGQKLNVNLLNRVDIQRQLSASKDPAERDKLRSDLNQNAADGNAALLKVHDRYTAQYALSLTQTAQSLEPLKDSLIPGIDKAVAAAFPAEASRPDSPKLVAGLTAAYTEFTDALAKVDTALKVADTDTTRLGKVEDSLFNAFDALRRYRRTIYGQMNSTTGICSADEPTCAKAAGVAQVYIKDQLAPIIAQHRAALAGYDNALFNLEDIATTK